jgi:hypothetical protein
MLQRNLILAFFNKYLKNDDADLEALESRYSEMAISKNLK